VLDAAGAPLPRVVGRPLDGRGPGIARPARLEFLEELRDGLRTGLALEHDRLRTRRDRQARPADRVTGAQVELEVEGERRAAREADGLVELDHDRVALPELRIDRPAAPLVGVARRRRREVRRILLVVRLRRGAS